GLSRSHVRMGGRRVEVEVVLLHVLAVIALVAVETEEAFLQDRVAAVPEGQREAEPPVVIADPGDAVLAPPVRARPRVVVREGLPDRAVGAVVLADGSPLTRGQVRTPSFPVGRAVLGFLEPQLLSRRSSSPARALRAIGRLGHGVLERRRGSAQVWRMA